MGNEQMVPAGQQTGLTQREEFGAQEMSRAPETASAAVAAQAAASVNARYIVAARNPRDWDVVRDRFLKECRRPYFAEMAIYFKPIGKGIEGPTIRFVEAALRCMGNVLSETSVVFDDTSKRIVRVTVTDLEANVSYPKDVVVEKTIERTSPKDGQTVISSRTNSRGARTYLVAISEDEMVGKQASAESKAIRGGGLRIFPGDIFDEGMAVVRETLANKAAKDPDGERKKLLDAFSSMNVPILELKEWVGHDLGSMSPSEIVDLKAVYRALRDGETTWADCLAEKRAERTPAQPFAGQVQAPPAPAAPTKPATHPTTAQEPHGDLPGSMGGTGQPSTAAPASAPHSDSGNVGAFLAEIEKATSALSIAALKQKIAKAAQEIGQDGLAELQTALDARMETLKPVR